MAVPDVEHLTLLNVEGALERFQVELNRVLENICDENTKAEAVRSVTLKVTFKPNEERMITAYTVECTSKTAAMKPATGLAQLVYKGEKITHAEPLTGRDPRQMALDDQPGMRLAGGKDA